MTVHELVSEHAAWAGRYYRRVDGSLSGEARVIAHACRPLVACCGPARVDDLRSRDALRVQEAMVAVGWSRRTCNDRMRRVRSVLRWGAVYDYCGPDP